jgi:PAS domain S-box-containing protein
MRFSIIPIPALITIIAVFYSIDKPFLFFAPAWLLPITNTVFITVVFLIVAYVAMNNYSTTGRIQILFLGCGVLAFGIGEFVGSLFRNIPGTGINLYITIRNTSSLIGAIFHFMAAWIFLVGISLEVGSKRRKLWLVLSYVGLTIFVALFTKVSLGGIIPPFFVQGVGPTALRQGVLGSAAILFAFSFLIFASSYLKNREVFLYWYSLALALTSIGLTAFLLQGAVGSLVGWAGRFSQYLAGMYFLIAIMAAFRSAHTRNISIDRALAVSLIPAEEKIRALVEDSPDIIDRFDRELKHVYVNRAGLHLYGKPVEAIIGKTIEETGVPEPYCRLWRERISRVFEIRQPDEVEVTFPSAKGLRYYHARFVPEFAQDRTVEFVLVSSRDITERKRAEEALADRTVQLERMNRELAALNAELDEFTNVASHDLQEPLRTLTAFSDLLRKDLGQSLPERAAQDLGFITDATKRMQTLIRDLLALSRAGRVAKRREKVSLRECAGQALEALAMRVKETGAKISRDEMPDVWGDSTLLTELYQNLIGNALKFSGDQPPIIQLTFEERDGDHIFGVKDNGIGIEPKYAQQIFQPFRRLHGRAKYEGTGIGLAICRKVVERHGGKIWVESEPGKGAHFRFTIPHSRRKR